MNQIAENPRAVVGSNQAPDYAKRVTEQMARDYAALMESVDALIKKAEASPKEITTDEEALALGAIVKEIRDAFKRAEAFREAEKEPHFRAGQAVDQFFFALEDQLARRNRTARPGAADILQARIDAHLERKRIIEAERRRKEAEELARAARQRAEEEARLRRQEEEARAVAERARKPENAAVRHAEADQIAAQASEATVEAQVAQEKATEAHVATLAKPAELSRTRGGADSGGVLLTEARQPYAILVDRTKIDMVKLRPYFNDAEIEKALRGWAKAHNHAVQMDGAEIGFRMKGQTR